MSVPTLTGLTSISAADSTTNWSGWGQNSGKWALEADIVKEGSGSLGIAPFQTGDGGYGYDSAGGIDLAANLLMIWVYTTPGFASAMASYGVYVRITTGASWTTEYSDFKVGGSDVAWFGRGWHLIVLDCNRTRDRGTGTTTLTNINRVGVGFNITATASKSTIMAIDAMYYGSGIEVTGPSFTDGTNGIDINSGGTIDRNDAGSFITDGYEVGDYVRIDGSTSNDGVYGPLTTVTAGVLTISGQTFTQETANTVAKVLASVTLEDIYQKDGPTDDLWKGVVDKDPGGAYIINYPLTIGDVSGANDVFFLSRGEVVVLADQPLDTTREDYIVTAEDTGETFVVFGNSDGTGDSRVGYAGSVVVGQGTVFDDGGSTSSSVKTPRGLDLSAEVAAMEFFGTSVIGADGGVDFAATGTGHYITTVTFDSCGQVDLGAVESRGLTFTGYAGAADAALLWSGTIDIKNSQFLANTRGIEHPTATGSPFAYDNLTFSGNTFDVNNSSGASISINLNNGSDATTSTGSTVTFLGQSVTLTITARDQGDSTLIEGAAVTVLAAANTAFPYQESVTITRSGSTATVSHTAHGLATGNKVLIEGADQNEYNRIKTITVTGVDAYTFTVSGTPTTPATGTIKATAVLIDGLTNASGVISDTRVYSVDQAIEGYAAKGTTSPIYKRLPLGGTVDKDNGVSITAFMVSDE
jgi:hypothetical protein